MWQNTDTLIKLSVKLQFTYLHQMKSSSHGTRSDFTVNMTPPHRQHPAVSSLLGFPKESIFHLYPSTDQHLLNQSHGVQQCQYYINSITLQSSLPSSLCIHYWYQAEILHFTTPIEFSPKQFNSCLLVCFECQSKHLSMLNWSDI